MNIWNITPNEFHGVISLYFFCNMCIITLDMYGMWNIIPTIQAFQGLDLGNTVTF
jgi:hypothetical protein